LHHFFLELLGGAAGWLRSRPVRSSPLLAGRVLVKQRIRNSRCQCKIVSVEKEAIQEVVTADAALFPINQSAGLPLPADIRVEYGSIYKQQQKSFQDLVVVLALAIVLDFAVLLFEFRTFAAPTSILSSALLSTSSVFIALIITRTTLSVPDCYSRRTPLLEPRNNR
jgi:multidrug efflux pump subunit AcrB